jgi:ABC-type nitrate/sulfonate/bicarbonate transport system substrate-binding protein
MDDLVFRLRERARIRRQIPTRKSVQEGKPDRISDLLEEAADEIEWTNKGVEEWRDIALYYMKKYEHEKYVVLERKFYNEK